MRPFCTLLQSEPVASVLDIGGIEGARRGDRVDAAAGGATAYMGDQYKGRATPLAKGGQTAVGNRSISHGAAVGLCHKFYQFPPFGKRAACTIPLCAATSTSCHIEFSFK
jgi:hypothetical protein